MQLAELQSALFAGLQYIFICIFIITSIVVEI